jgi:glycerophosphoryl diester phosphodiesterase
MRLAILAVLAGCNSGTTTPREQIVPRPERPRIVAHRGASGEAPENTLAAFRRAWALGVEAVELDVHVTKDGHPVVIHDLTTKRTTGMYLVIAESTLTEIQELDAGSWKGAAYKGEKIPTLAETLATIPPGRAMFVELKSDASTVATVAEVIRKGRPSNSTILLQAYDADSLAQLAAALPDAPAYWTVDPPTDANKRKLPYPTTVIDECVRRGFPGIALDYAGIDDAFLAAARKAGLLVDVWTLNTTPLLAGWLDRDVRWIETDYPELAPVRR